MTTTYHGLVVMWRVARLISTLAYVAFFMLAIRDSYILAAVTCIVGLLMGDLSLMLRDMARAIDGEAGT
jgi:hypothetical protein